MSKIAPARLKMVYKVAVRYANALVRAGKFRANVIVSVRKRDGAIIVDGKHYRIAQINAMRRELEARELV